MTAIEPRFTDEADRQIAAEDKAARDRRVLERALALRGESQRNAAGEKNILNTAAARLERLKQLKVRERELVGPLRPRIPAGDGYLAQVPRQTTSAADDDALRRVQAQIHELMAQCRLDGTIEVMA